MNKTLNFSQRNFKEVLRDPIIYIFCLGFPLVLLVLFQIIAKYAGESTPTFALKSLVPGIILFSYTFVMLTMTLLVSKDRQTSFLKRLYSSPMKPRDYILGYATVGLTVGIVQTAVCILAGVVIAAITQVEFLSFGRILLLAVSQLPMLIAFVFLGILFGTLFNDKSAPGISSAIISLVGVLGGCWMPVEAMGGFATFCKCLPFYPSVTLGRIASQATSALGEVFNFDAGAWLYFLPIGIFLAASIALALIVFKKKMTSD